MNRILFEAQADTYTLSPRDKRFEHVRGVLRLGLGDSFDVGVLNGPVGKARVEALDKASLSVAVEWGGVPPQPPPVYLLVAMCRPATARKLLSTIPTLGVRALSFVPTAHSDPAYARSSLWEADGWRPRLIEGVEQAFDTWLPELHLPDSLEDAMVSIPDVACKLALDVYEGSRPLSQLKVATADSVCLAVGPERGWAPADRATLRTHGFELLSLGDRVMRVETAVTAGLALLLASMGRL